MYTFNKDYKFSIDGCNIIEAKQGEQMSLPDIVAKRLLLKGAVGEIETQEVKEPSKKKRNSKAKG